MHHAIQLLVARACIHAQHRVSRRSRLQIKTEQGDGAAFLQVLTRGGSEALGLFR